MYYLVAMIPAAVASIFDLREDRIPNALIIIGGLGGPLLGWIISGLAGVVYALISGIIVFAILFPVYLIRGIGAGDVKLMVVLAMYMNMPKGICFMIVSFVLAAAFSLIRLVMKKQLFLRLNRMKGYILDCVQEGRVLPYRSFECDDSYIRLAPFMLMSLILMFLWEVLG